MTELLAHQDIPDYETMLVNLEDIFSERDEAAILDPKFVAALHKSLDEKGMQYPIIIRDGKEDGKNTLFSCWIGNNRIHYAKTKGYTHIAAVFAKTDQDKRNIVQHTRMEYCKDF